jgi:hypothetical protein
VIPSDAAAPPDAAPNPVAIPPIVFVPETSSKTKDVSNSSAAAQPEPKHLAVADVATPNVAVIDFRANVTRTVSDVRPVLHDKEAGARPKVSLTFTAVITENESDDIGLDWIFGLAPTNNPALEVSHDGTALQTSPPLRGQSLVIDRFHTRGQSVVLKPEQFAALCDRIVRKWDLLNSPACVTASGLQAHIAVQDVTEVVTDVKVAKGHGTNGISVGYITDDIAVGPVVDILPTRMENGRWRLRVIARETTFIGYDNYGREFGSLGLVSVPGGKPLGYQIPHPHFRSVEISSDDDLSLGQTLALRGPLWTEVTRTKGGFFSRAKTKTVRERLYVFVTPTAVPAPALEK